MKSMTLMADDFAKSISCEPAKRAVFPLQGPDNDLF
jgi:hypothetical protein